MGNIFLSWTFQTNNFHLFTTSTHWDRIRYTIFQKRQQIYASTDMYLILEVLFNSTCLKEEILPTYTNHLRRLNWKSFNEKSSRCMYSEALNIVILINLAISWCAHRCYLPKPSIKVSSLWQCNSSQTNNCIQFVSVLRGNYILVRVSRRQKTCFHLLNISKLRLCLFLI